MTAIEFLRTKGIMENNYTKWIVTWKNGKKVDLVELMEEYAKHKEDFANVIGGFEPDYAYKTVKEFESIVGYEVNDSFKSGFMFARITNKQLGIEAQK